MSNKNYVIFTKSTEGDKRTIKLSAGGHVVSSDGRRLSFEDSDTTIAIFNLADIVGFAQMDHIVN